MRKLWGILFSLVLALAVMSPAVLAQDDGNGEETDAENQAYVRYVNLRSDGMGADFYFDGELSDSANLETSGVSQWTAVAPGAHTFGAVDTGGTLEESGAQPSDLELLPGEWVNVITTGQVNDFSPAEYVGQTLPRVVGTLRPVNIGSFDVWIIYPRTAEDLTLP